jgi:hypothetical protein
MLVEHFRPPKSQKQTTRVRSEAAYMRGRKSIRRAAPKSNGPSSCIAVSLPLQSLAAPSDRTHGPSPGGWRVTEIWDTQADFEACFETSVKPVFPEGAPMPSISFDELNEVVKG